MVKRKNLNKNFAKIKNKFPKLIAIFGIILILLLILFSAEITPKTKKIIKEISVTKI